MVPVGCPPTYSFQFLIVSMGTSFLHGRSWRSKNSKLFIRSQLGDQFCVVRHPKAAFTRFMHMDLQVAQAENRREWKRVEYRRTLPLSAYKRIMAVTIWWEAGKLVGMALRYLEIEYLATRKRCRITDDVLAGVSAHGVAHPFAVPEHWLAVFGNALHPSLMSSRLRPIIRKARNFSTMQRQRCF